MGYKRSLEEKAKAARENGFDDDDDDDCIILMETLPYINGRYEDLDNRTTTHNPPSPRAIIDNM
jgi:hypothetical protein